MVCWSVKLVEKVVFLEKWLLVSIKNICGGDFFFIESYLKVLYFDLEFLREVDV